MSVQKDSERWIVWALTGSILLSALFIALLAAVPPVTKDALVHHLAVPKIYLRHGGMVELPSMPFSYYPMNLELLYWASLALGSDILPTYIHFAFALITAWVLFQYLKTRLSPAYGALGALLFLSVPVIIKLSITAYIDLGVVCFVTCAILFLLKWLETGFRLPFFAASACFCGLAVGTKYNGLVALFLLTLSVPLLYSRRAAKARGRSARALGWCAGYVLLALLVCSPWLVRNDRWTGNPLYPLYRQWFEAADAHAEGSDGRSVSRSAVPQRVGQGIFTYRSVIYGESGWEIALLPLRIFFQGKDGNPRLFDGRLHPFLLVLPFFAFLRSREGSAGERLEKRYLLAFAVLFFSFALFSRTLRMRYIAPIIPPLVILSVFGVRNLLSWIRSLGSSRMQRMAGMTFGLGMLAAGVYSAGYLVSQYGHVQPFRYLSGELSRDAYITAFRPEYPVMQYANRETPQNAKVLLAFMGRRGYYLDRDYIPGVARLGTVFRKAGTPEAAMRVLEKDHITHLLVFLPILEEWAEDNLDRSGKDRMKRFFRQRTRLLRLNGGYGLFEVG